MAGWKPVSSEAKDDVNEEEVHQLFNLIDTERTGYITPAVRFKPNYASTINDAYVKFSASKEGRRVDQGKIRRR